MPNPSELQPLEQDFNLRTNDLAAHKMLGAVVSRESFALNTIGTLYSSNVTLDPRYSVFRFDASGGTFAATLPSAGYWSPVGASTVAKGGVLHLVNSGTSGNVTVTGSGTETIDGSNTYTLYPGHRITLVSMGTVLGGWRILESSSWPTAFTPVVSGLTTAGLGTYATQTGVYSITGPKTADISMLISWTAHTGTGQTSISIPFTLRTGTFHIFSSMNTIPGLAAGDKSEGLGIPGAARVDMYYENTGAIGAINITATATLRLSGTVIFA